MQKLPLVTILFYDATKYTSPQVEIRTADMVVHISRYYFAERGV